MKLISRVIAMLCMPFIIFCNPTDLDTSFNDTGYALISFATGQTQNPTAIALQEDRKSVIVGTSGSSGYIARYTVNGELDSTFNSTGSTFFAPTGTTSCSISAIVIVPSTQKIIVGGKITISSVTTAFVAQYTTAGVLDTNNFGSGLGYVTCNSNGVNSITGLALQTNEQIVATAYNNSSIVTRYNSNGTLDTINFNASLGYVILPSNGIARCVAIQEDDKIVVAGQITASSINQFFIARYTNTGVLDTATFGSGNGYIASQIGSSANGLALAIQDNQKILVAGYSNITGTSFNDQYATVARYTTTGDLDTSFNYPYGYIRTGQQWFQAIALQEDQQIICGGFALDYQTYVTRLTTDGLVDSTFNIIGGSTPPANIIRGVAVQFDKKIITTGQTEFNNLSNNITARYLGGQELELATSSISIYGQNFNFISEFLYNDFYATIITNTTARSATIAAINEILTNYATNYVNQPNFNYVGYLYLLQSQFDEAQATLLIAYPSSTTEINQFFIYLAARMINLAIS